MNIISKFTITFFILFKFSSILSQINTGDWLLYKSNGSESKGLEFSIKYPSTWFKSKGDHLSIIQKFSPETGVGLLIQIIKFEDTEDINPDEFLRYEICKSITNQTIIKYGGKNIKYLLYKNSFLDGCKALILEYAYDIETISSIETNRCIKYMSIYKNYVVIFEGRTTCSKDILNHEQIIKEYMNRYRPYFNEIVNSFVNISKSKGLNKIY